MPSNIVYGPQVVVDSDLALWYDMASPKCWNGNSNITTEIYNLAPQRDTYPKMGWDATSTDRTGFGFYISPNVPLSGNTFQTIYGATVANNNNYVGNFMEGAGNLSLTVNNNFTTMAWHASTFPRQSTLLAYRRHHTTLRFSVDHDSMDFYQRHTSSPYATQNVTVSHSQANNVFAHYALVKAGLPNAQQADFSFYKNGEHMGTSSLTLSEQISAGNYYDIGQDWSDDDYYSNNSEGFFGPTMHYTRALTHNEVRQNFNALRSRFKV